MTDRQLAATPWEVEAERRRETIAADAAVARRDRADAAGEVLTLARGRRLVASLRGASRPTGRLDGTGV